MGLTSTEQKIVGVLRRDPLAGSEVLARELGTSRAAINVHLSNLGRKGVIRGRGYVLDEQRGVLVIGGANMDLKARSRDELVPATSNPGSTTASPGGVGRNIAENLARLGTRTHLVAVLGDDELGRQVLALTAQAGVHVEHVRRTAAATGTYTAVLGHDGELVAAVADMAATDTLGVEQVGAARDLLASAGLVVLDGNIAAHAIGYTLDLAATAGVPVLLEPVSVPKASALASLIAPDRPVHVVTPNHDELAALTGLPVGSARQQGRAVDSLHERGVEHVWVRLGADGSLLSSPDGRHEIPSVRADVADVTGAGDAMVGAFCHALLEGAGPEEAARFAHAAAALTVASPHTVRPDLTDRLVRSSLR